MSGHLTFLLAAPPAKTFLLRGSARAWTGIVVTYRSNTCDWLIEHAPAGWSGKTSPVSCPSTPEGRLAPSSGRWANSGMGSPTAFFTLNTSEFHSAAAVCSLSDILETGDLPQRYYLSATACRGILRRAVKRGRELPRLLQMALERVALTTTKPKPGI